MRNDKKYEFGKVCSRRRMLFCCKKNAQSSQMAMYNFHIAWVCVSSCICRTTHTDAYNHYVMQLQLPILFCLCNVFIVVFFCFCLFPWKLLLPLFVFVFAICWFFTNVLLVCVVGKLLNFSFFRTRQNGCDMCFQMEQ